MSRTSATSISGAARTARRALAGATALVLGAGLAVPLTATPAAAAGGQGFTLTAADLGFILDQIKIAERHAKTRTAAEPCATLIGERANQIPNTNGHGVELPWGLRTVDGSCNNLVAGREQYGTADRTFPRLTPVDFRTAEGTPAFMGPTRPTTYTQKSGVVSDAQPRLISNLVVDQTVANPAAVAAAGQDAADQEPGTTLDIPNVAPDEGLSAPYNSWFTLFGQFFDHGLDLVSKGGSGSVFVPLSTDDPLYDADGADGVAGNGDEMNFMILTRTTNRPGPDGKLGTTDDVQEGVNQTSPFVDQSQTYSSHPAHQVFLRHYAADAAGKPVSSGRLLTGPGDGMATWADVKAQSTTLLGIDLADTDVHNVPMVATDPYGRFERGPNGYPQLVTPTGLVEGNPAAPVSPAQAGALRIGHAFLDDIAHHAAPKPGMSPDADEDATTDDRVATTYDDEMLDAHFIAGDGRVNENIGLTAVHNVFHGEHNRLVGDIQKLVTDAAAVPDEEWQLPGGAWNGERVFQAARFVAEMEYQHLAFEEFARRIQPQVNLFSGYDTSIDPAITAEFAHAVYRFGHSLLTESVDRIDANGVRRDIPLMDAFLNPPAYFDGDKDAKAATGDIVRGMSAQVGAEMDEFVPEVLRNNLVGLPLDLATLNIARARDTGIARLNDARRAFHAASGQDSALAPYASWVDYGFALRNPQSLVNFVAAYGTHPTITGDVANRRTAAARLVTADPTDPATPADAADFMNGTGAFANKKGRAVTGLEDVDLWVGGLAEAQQPMGGLLGNTFNYVFEAQMEKLQEGDRFYYLSRTGGLNLGVQLEGNSFAELVSRNSDAEGLQADLFSTPELRFDLRKQNATGPIVDDAATEYDERRLLVRMTDGTVRFNGPEHVLFVGTPGKDTIRSGEGDDTVRGLESDDRLEGGAGNDTILGGDGDDIITDSFGDDTTKGGDGNDAINAGRGLDLNQPGLGDDFVVGGSDPAETLAGQGDDFVQGGESADIVVGNDGDDWLEGGNQADELSGDNHGEFPETDLAKPGHDVLIGAGGDDVTVGESGDDVLVAGPGIERNRGLFGFDWVTHKDDVPANADLSVTGEMPPALAELRDRFDMVEGLSGWKHDDVLRGDDTVAEDLAEHDLNAKGIERVTGLGDVLGAGSFTGGNVLLGGGGSDLIEGRGGDDVIDGDRWLNVRIARVNGQGAEIGSYDSMSAARADVFAGKVNPGRLRIVREVLTAESAASDIDTVVFSGRRDRYDFTPNADLMTVTDLRNEGPDGIDTLRGIERLTFADGTVEITSIPGNTPASGTVGISNATPSTGDALTASAAAVVDPDGLGEMAFAWQAETARGSASYIEVATGASFEPTADLVGRRLRVVATFTDKDGVTESITSAATEPVTGVPAAPVIGSATAGSGRATFTWTAPVDDGGYPVSDYVIKVLDSADNQVGELHTVSAGTTSITVTGLAAGRTVRAVVAASNVNGTSVDSAPSAPVTVLGDVTAPVVSAVSPVDMATRMNAAVSPFAVLNEALRADTVTTSTVRLHNTANNTVVPATVTYTASNRRVTVNPTANLAHGATYRVTLTGGAKGLRDLAGNPLATYSWSFTTAPAPAVTSTNPRNGATNVSRAATWRANLSVPVTGVSTATAVVKPSAGGAAVRTRVTLTSGGRVLQIDPTGSLARSTRYTVTLTGGATKIRSLDGVPFTTRTFTFVTAR